MDGWLCGDCKSLNKPRTKSCYRCNVPRRFGESAQDLDSVTITRTAGGLASTARPSSAPGWTIQADPSPGAGAAAAAAASARPRPTVSDTRSSRGRSRVLMVMLTITTAASALSTAMLMARGGTKGLVFDLLAMNRPAIDTLILVSIAGVGLTILTAIAWFVWFDRVLRNVPGLTGEWPDTGRLGAIGWWLVPVVGFIKAPRIVGDVYNRLAVPGTPGLWLLALWALTWIGGTVAPYVADRLLGFLPLPLDLLLGLSDLITLLGQASYLAAGLFAVAMVLAIEHASDTRRAGGGAAVERPVFMPDEARLGTAFQAAAEVNFRARVAQFGSTHPGSLATVAWAGPPAMDGPDRPMLQPVARPPAYPRPAATPATGGGPGGFAGDTRGAVPAAGDAAAGRDASAATGAAVGAASGAGAPSGAPAAASGAPAAAAAAPGAPAAVTAPVAADAPSAVGSRPATASVRGRPAVPLGILGLVGLVLVLAMIAGVVFAGPRSAGPRRDPGGLLAAPLLTPRPAGTPAPTGMDDPTDAPPAATPSPRPAWMAVAADLASGTFAEDWVGRWEVEGTLKVGTDTLPVSVSVARSGDTEWSRVRVTEAATGAVLATEQVILDRTTWVRPAGGDWERRDRTFADQPSEALFGIPDAAGLTFVRSFQEDGRRLFEFEATGASDLLALSILRAAGVGPVIRTAATVVADDAGRPVRASLAYAGATRDGKVRLELTIRYRDVGGDFRIGSPREGEPVID